MVPRCNNALWEVPWHYPSAWLCICYQKKPALIVTTPCLLVVLSCRVDVWCIVSRCNNALWEVRWHCPSAWLCICYQKKPALIVNTPCLLVVLSCRVDVWCMVPRCNNALWEVRWHCPSAWLCICYQKKPALIVTTPCLLVVLSRRVDVWCIVPRCNNALWEAPWHRPSAWLCICYLNMLTITCAYCWSLGHLADNPICTGAFSFIISWPTSSQFSWLSECKYIAIQMFSQDFIWPDSCICGILYNFHGSLCVNTLPSNCSSQDLLWTSVWYFVGMWYFDTCNFYLFNQTFVFLKSFRAW